MGERGGLALPGAAPDTVAAVAATSARPRGGWLWAAAAAAAVRNHSKPDAPFGRGPDPSRRSGVAPFLVVVAHFKSVVRERPFAESEEEEEEAARKKAATF